MIIPDQDHVVVSFDFFPGVSDSDLRDIECIDFFRQRSQKEGIKAISSSHVDTDVIFMDQGVIVEQGDPELVFGAPQQERTKQFLRKYQQ